MSSAAVLHEAWCDAGDILDALTEKATEEFLACQTFDNEIARLDNLIAATEWRTSAHQDACAKMRELQQFITAKFFETTEIKSAREKIDELSNTIKLIEDNVTSAATAKAPESEARTPQAEGNKSQATGAIFYGVSGRASEVKKKAVRWLWPKRIAVKLNLIVGNPDVAKSLIALDIVAHVTNGKPWFDSPNANEIGEALVMAAEDDWDDTIAPRLEAAGADLTRVHWLKMQHCFNQKKSERELQLDQDMNVLENYLAANPGIKVVVIDPVSNYLGNTKMVDEQSVRKILTPLKELANRIGVAIVCVMHLNKKVDLDAIHRVGGAMAFVGVARMVWLCAPKPVAEDEISEDMVMVKLKGNIVQRTLKGLSYTTKVRMIEIEGSDEAIPFVNWTGEINQQAHNLGNGDKPKNPQHRPPEQMKTAAEWLAEYLKDGAKPLKDIEHAGKSLYGLSPSTLLRTRTKLGVITFSTGKETAKDGKSRETYSCRLPSSDVVNF